MLKLMRWAEVEDEVLSPLTQRQYISGEKLTLARFTIRKGARVAKHSHEHEQKKTINLTPWILFTIFVFGPCEPLIPIVMYPAAQHNYSHLAIVTLVFSAITIVTMLTVVTIASRGINLLPMKTLEKYSHALAGATIFLCGIGMLFLGL